MTFDDWLPLLTLLTSLLPGIVIFVLPEERIRWRTTLNLGGSGLKLALIGVMIWGVHHEHVYETRLPILPDIDLVLNAERFSNDQMVKLIIDALLAGNQLIVDS